MAQISESIAHLHGEDAEVEGPGEAKVELVTVHLVGDKATRDGAPTAAAAAVDAGSPNPRPQQVLKLTALPLRQQILTAPFAFSIAFAACHVTKSNLYIGIAQDLLKVHPFGRVRRNQYSTPCAEFGTRVCVCLYLQSMGDTE